MAGVWANAFEVTRSPYEFTIDFIRLDFSTETPTGTVAARVAMGPLLMSELWEELGTEWQAHTRQAMPKEVFGDEEPA